MHKVHWAPIYAPFMPLMPLLTFMPLHKFPNQFMQGCCINSIIIAATIDLLLHLIIAIVTIDFEPPDPNSVVRYHVLLHIRA